MIGDYAVFFKNKQGMFEGYQEDLQTERWLRRRCSLYGHY